MNVLLIEDDAASAEIIKAFFEGEEAFQLESVAHLNSGLDRLAEGGIDLVLLDFNLPDSEGIETFLRTHEHSPNVAIIPLTAVSDESLALKAIQLGAQDYLFKSSISRQLLTRSMRYAVERKRGEEALRRAHNELEQRVRERTSELSDANAALTEQIAERRKAEEELRKLSHRLVQVQENERHNIARELHDEIGQLLTGLKLTLEMSNREPGRDLSPEQNDRGKTNQEQTGLERTGPELTGPERTGPELTGPELTGKIVNELMGRVRDLSLNLRPAMLDDLGLLHALFWHFERYTAQTGIRVIFNHTGLEAQRLEPEIETAAYRIIQEALTNVARYANVGEVKVYVTADAENLSVQVFDQGKGFLPEVALASGSSSGLTGMRERAQLLGGTLMIDAAPDSGAKLTALLPIGE
ncbi:MAG: response regulator [Blastocatellales bacterium]